MGISKWKFVSSLFFATEWVKTVSDPVFINPIHTQSFPLTISYHGSSKSLNYFLPTNVRWLGLSGELDHPLYPPSLFPPTQHWARKSMALHTLLWKVLTIFFLCICTVTCLIYERVSHYLSKSSSFSLSFVKPFLFLMAHEPFLSNAFTLLNSCYSLPVWTVSFSRD